MSPDDPLLRAMVRQALILGLSQREAAEKLGVSCSMVWRALQPVAPKPQKPAKVIPACRTCGAPVSSSRWRQCKPCASDALGRRMTGVSSPRRGRPHGSPNDPVETAAHIEQRLALAEAEVKRRRPFTADAWRCSWRQYQ